jgi:hypothetical protein
MSRHPSTYASVLKAADHFEPRFRTQLVASTLRLRKSVSLRDLAALVSAKDSRRAAAYIKAIDTGDVMKQAVALVTEAFKYGGKIGATKVTRRG